MKLNTEAAVLRFDTAPDTALVDIPAASAIACRRRASIYRHFKAGDLTPGKVGNSTGMRGSEGRRLIGVI